jgi:hypothetical protein
LLRLGLAIDRVAGAGRLPALPDGKQAFQEGSICPANGVV